MTPSTRSKPIAVGDQIPDVTLADHRGVQRSLSEFRGRPLVVYFYPANNTPACTAEACAFRDEFEHLQGLDAEVIGISADSVASHAAFARRHNLPFTLLSDEHNHARAAFGVPKTLGLFPGRVTYVIDQQGIVRHITTSALNARRHVRDSIRALSSSRP